jgi:orotidine-5'-phosphate decarboxylase
MNPTPFADRLDAAIARTGNPCLLGIDPHLDLLPDEFALTRDHAAPRAARARELERFCLELVELAAGRVPAVKPQSAFFEVFGADGALAWERVVREARSAGLLVIGDVKRGDIATTASAYATAYLDPLPGLERESACDAITISPWLGRDTLDPFLAACRSTGGGLFVLVRTSNPGSAQFQRGGAPHASDLVADAVNSAGDTLLGACGLSSVGAVTGATHAGELAALRARMPRTPLLLPGYGAQGATARDVVPAFLPRGRGALVASSRGVAFAQRSKEHAGKPWKDAARAALEAMIADVRGALAST